MLINFLKSEVNRIVGSTKNFSSVNSLCRCSRTYHCFKLKLVNSNLSFSPDDVRFYCLFTNNLRTTSLIVRDKFSLFKTTGFVDIRNLSTQKYLENKKPSTDVKITELELKQIFKRFPHTKNVLHTYFDNVALELNSQSYKIKPQYKVVQPKGKPLRWTCIYSITWPQEMKFQSTASSKQEASLNAAGKVLCYLEKTEKILNNGLPIIYDKETFHNIVRTSHYVLKLNKNEQMNLERITTIFGNDLKPIISKYSIEKQTSVTDVSNGEEIILQDLTNHDTKKTSSYFHKCSAKELTDLPIQKHRKEFENFLESNRVIIVRGEPGCGKSTRIPQYILEHWVNRNGFEPVKIVVTQPRRIAAISLAERVAEERSETVGDLVGYHVRLKSAFNPRSGKILYCTTGILLRQLQSDPKLSQCTHVLLDEAHERDVNTDLLMNLLRRALDLNPNLKLIIMSATIDVRLFQNYFSGAPVMNIPGFTYPVKVHFLEDLNLNLYRTRELSNNSSPYVVPEEVVNVIQWIDMHKPEGAILCFLPGWDEISKIKNLLTQVLDPKMSMVLALHSKLSDSDQHKIFKRPPPGVRKVILATNIAETSVTVDDVVYVVDCGIHKENRFDPEKGIMCMDNHWISQSSMNQRKGRAGRVRPGESFHLYFKDKYESLPKYSIPEILRVSLTKIVLDAKVYSGNMDANEFFSYLPSPPEDMAVLQATKELQELELLDENENVTSLGRIVSEFQLSPKLSKAMVNSVIYKCITPVVDIATIFSSDVEMFHTALTDKANIKSIKQQMRKGSDHVALMMILEQWLTMLEEEDYNGASSFCTKYNLNPHKLRTLQKLETIHYEYLQKYLKRAMDLSDDYAGNEEIVKGVLLSGVGTMLMLRNWSFVKGRLKRDNVYITNSGQKATITTESVNAKLENAETQFLLYINETRSVIRRTILIRETSLLKPLTLLLFKNSNLKIEEFRDNVNTDVQDPVLLCIDGTKIKVLCSRKQAYAVLNCKKALKEIEKYFIYQLTSGGENNDDVQEYWNEILEILDVILRR